jgi:hypothetical protein
MAIQIAASISISKVTDTSDTAANKAKQLTSECYVIFVHLLRKFPHINSSASATS